MSVKSTLRKQISSARETLARLLILFCVAGSVTLLMMPLHVWLGDGNEFREGTISRVSIRAPREFIVLDSENTARKREEALRKIKPVLSARRSKNEGVEGELRAFFQLLREAGTVSPEQSSLLIFDKHGRSKLRRQFGLLNFSKEEWTLLSDTALWPQLESNLKNLLDPLLKQGIIANKNAITKLLKSNGAVLRIEGRAQEEVLRPESEFLDLSDSVETLKLSIGAAPMSQKQEYSQLLEKVALIFLRANVFYDSRETRRRREEVERSIEPIYHHIKQGELIVQAGEQIDAVRQAKLNKLLELGNVRTVINSTVSRGVLVFCALVILFAFTLHAWRTFRPATKDLILIALSLLGSFAMVEIYLLIGQGLNGIFAALSPQIFVLAAPIAAAGILLQVTLNTPTVFFFLTSFGVMSSIFLQDIPELWMLAVLGNIIGVLSVKKWSRRSAFLIAGARVAIVNIAVVLCYFVMEPGLDVSTGTMKVLAAIIGGLSSGILGAMLTPVAEYFGSYLTDIRLLELSSLDHPLLRELSLQAPGTWNHSMVMGQLAEAAAESIGANSLLARVGAYYHDIGKASKPAYFVENQASRDNRHDRLSPFMSALIIKAHVKEGIELAEEHHIPQAVIDFISQHHGTALIEFFYDKALKEAEPDQKIDDALFRYSGPKPQTKEAGILMLADNIEAATRTIIDPNPSRIQGAVQKVLNRIFASGQLDECELTLQDLHAIAKSFTRMLCGIYHRRIQYAEPAEKRGGVRSDGVSASGSFRTEGIGGTGSFRTDRMGGTGRFAIDRAELSERRVANIGESAKNERRDAREKGSGEPVPEGTAPEPAAPGSKEALKRLGM